MRAIALLVVGALGLGSSVVYAKPKGESPDRQARKACAAGDYRKGVDLLADLYVSTEDPTYIYNQGRCYEQNHQWVSAIDRFREYLRKSKDHGPEIARDVEQHIAECKRLLDEETGKTAPPPVVVVAPLPPVTPAPADITVVPPPSPPPPPTRHPGAALRTTGLIVGSAGVAGLATGILLNLKANSLGKEANERFNPSAESSYQSYKTGAIICYALGGAALATGVTLYIVGHAKGKNSTSLALSPLWTSGHTGLALSGEF